MKSFSKRVASFAMAAAMVLSVAAVSPVDAEAATAKITKKSSITAGKTYTYNVKNVTKSQYIKVRMSSGVTVKYNNKTVKKDSTKIKGGKTIALKVKAADKVGNYKATLKAVIYNKKNNKKVKTLTTQSTVKCTTLKVTSVQTASSTGKYLVATFNKALDSLNPADIEIRNLNTNELKGVEEVKLASNGKSATITLAGSEWSMTSTNIKNDFVEPNVDYSFTVNKNGATATTRFTVDAVAAYATVLNYNVDTRELTLSYPKEKNTNVVNQATDVKVPETVSADNFQSLLGRTVSVWYNKNDVATKVVANEETVVEGAFVYIERDVTTPYFKDKVTGKQYYVSENIGDTSDVHNTYAIWHTANGYTDNVGPDGKVPAAQKVKDLFNDKDDIAYAKLVLYSNGKIRAMVGQEKYDEKLYVTKVDADKNYVYCGDNKSVNLKGFTIVDHDKLVSIKDIKVGDMLFVDLAHKFAEIYTTTKDGKVEAAYDGEFKFDGTLYKNDKVQLLPDSGKAKAPSNMTYKEASAFIAAGGAATVYLDRANQPVFIKGEQKYAATGSSVTVLATSDMKGYALGNKQYLQFNGFDGASKASYDICLDNLEFVTVSGNKYIIDKSKAEGTDVTAATDATNVLTTKNFKFSTNDIQTAGNSPLIDDGISNSMVELSKNAAGTIVGITVKNVVKPIKPFEGRKTYVQAVGGQNYQITATTPVYAWTVGDLSTLKKINYSDYSAITQPVDTFVYVNESGTGLNKKYEVSYVLVNSEVIAPSEHKAGVVTEIQKQDGKVAYVKMLVGNTEFETNLFRDDTVKTKLNAANAGDFVRVGVDGKTIVELESRVDKDSDDDMTSVFMPKNASGCVNVTGRTFKASTSPDSTTTNREISLAPECTVVRRAKNYQTTERYVAASLADLANLAADDVIRIHYVQKNVGDSTGFVDAIIIEKEELQ